MMTEQDEQKMYCQTCGKLLEGRFEKERLAREPGHARVRVESQAGRVEPVVADGHGGLLEVERLKLERLDGLCQTDEERSQKSGQDAVHSWFRRNRVYTVNSPR